MEERSTFTRQDDSSELFKEDYQELKNYFLWSANNQTLSQYDFPVKQDFELYTEKWSEQRYMIHHFCKYFKFNIYYKSLYILTLLFGLFGFNFYQLFLPFLPTIPFDILNGFCFVFYFINLVISLLGFTDYFNSFYFYIDILSTIIIFFDFAWLLNIFYNQDNFTNFLQIWRIYLFLEILRLVRVNLLLKEIFQPSYKNIMDYYKKCLLIPEYKLAKIFYLKKEENSETKSSQIKRSVFNNWQTSSFWGTIDQNFIYDNSAGKDQESKISKRILYLTNKRITMVLILLLILIPLMSAFFWYDIGLSYQYDLQNLNIMSQNTLSKNTVNTYVNQNLKNQYDSFRITLI